MSGDRQLANEIIQQCIQLNPGMAEGVPSRLLESFFSRSIADHSVDHEPVMERIFSYLPNTVAHPGTLLHWYQARGHLLKGTLAIMWEQPEAGQRHFDAAAQRKARIDRSYIRWLTSKMLTYQRYFGEEKTQAVIDRLSPHLRTTGGSSEARAAIGSLWVNRAFANFRLKNYPSALREVRQAVINDPRYLFNRGVLSVAVRSYLRKSKTRAV